MSNSGTLSGISDVVTKGGSVPCNNNRDKFSVWANTRHYGGHVPVSVTGKSRLVALMSMNTYCHLLSDGILRSGKEFAEIIRRNYSSKGSEETALVVEKI